MSLSPVSIVHKPTALAVGYITNNLISTKDLVCYKESKKVLLPLLDDYKFGKLINKRGKFFRFDGDILRLVIKIGGSMSIDEHGPKKEYFRKLIPVLKKIQRKHQLVVSIGGGKFIRDYYGAVRDLGLSNKEMEWIAIELLRVNVRFLSFMLKTKPLLSLGDIKPRTSGVIGGIAPRRSTDANAAYAAQKIKADLFVKLTDVDGIYTADPDKFKNAKKLDKISFKDVMKFAKTGKLGSYGILDRIALQIIKKNKIKTIVMSGKNPKDLLKAIRGEKIGTIISD